MRWKGYEASSRITPEGLRSPGLSCSLTTGWQGPWEEEVLNYMEGQGPHHSQDDIF